MVTTSTTKPSRGHTLQEAFFYRVDRILRDELKKKLDRDEQIDALSAASGLQNRELLEQLVDAGIDQSALAALSLVPCIFVAWADGSVSPSESSTILELFKMRSEQQDTMAGRLIQSWLQHRPPASLMKLWQDYAFAISESLSPFWRDALIVEIVDQAEKVAKAAGGLLGLGSVSAAEQRVLDEIRSCMSMRR